MREDDNNDDDGSSFVPPLPRTVTHGGRRHFHHCFESPQRPNFPAEAPIMLKSGTGLASKPRWRAAPRSNA
jgi:hypothetical protein